MKSRCTDKALADYRLSADNRHLTIGRYRLPYYRKLIFLYYLSYLFRLQLLSEDSYLLEGLQRVQTKQKLTQKQSYKTHPLLPATEPTLML